jgi:hypothetical protein
VRRDRPNRIKKSLNNRAINGLYQTKHSENLAESFSASIVLTVKNR